MNRQITTLFLVASCFGTAEPKPIVIQGSGNLFSTNVRTSTPLFPPCVSQVDRVGSVYLTGVITTAEEKNGYSSRALRDDCAQPPSTIGINSQRYQFQRATIAGRTGQILIEAQGTFEGDATTPPGTRNRLHWKITGIDGDLKGMEGEGMSVGISTAFSGQSAVNQSTYTVTLALKK